jgi:hypothetical protein
MVDHVPISIEAADGFRWSGMVTFGLGAFPSASTYSVPLTRAYVSFDLPTAVYTRLQAKPVTLRLTLPLTQLQATKVTSVSIPAQGQEVVVPDYGICDLDPGSTHFAQLRCHSAFRQPQITSAIAELADTPCSATQTELGIWMGDARWSGLLNSEPAEFGMGPVTSWIVGINGLNDNHKGARETHLCSGDAVTFTQYKPVRRMQTTATITNFQLPALK